MHDSQLEALLRQFTPFDTLDGDYLQQLEPHVEIIRESQGKLLFRRGKRAEFLYYLIEGSVELVAAGFASERLEGGSERARHSLDDSVPTRVSAVAKSPLRLLKVDADFLDLVLAWQAAPLEEKRGLDPEGDYQNPESSPGIESASGLELELVPHDWMSGLVSSPLMNRIPPAHMQQLFSRFERLEVAAGSVVVKEGQSGDYFYVLDRGEARVTTVAGCTDVTLGPGQYFGEEALVADAPRNATVTMLDDGVLMRLGKEDFNTLLRDPLQQYLTRGELQVMTGQTRLVDVRTPLEFRMQATPGAVNLPLTRLRRQCHQLDHDSRYVFVAEGGRRSQLGAYLLAQEGFDTYLLKPDEADADS